MASNNKVTDVYSIGEDALDAKADEGDEYWISCKKFYLSVKGNDVDNLSQKQRDWLDKIENSL